MSGSPGTSQSHRETDRAVSTVRAVAAAVVVLVAAVGGAFALGVVGAPSVVGVENRFGEVTNETTVVESDLVVNNPNPIGVRLGGVTADYAVTMNGITMAEGTKEGVGVTTGNTSVPFETSLDNSKIPAWWVSHVNNGEHTDLLVDADVRSSLVGQSYGTQVSRDVNTSIIEAFRTSEPKPLNASSPVVSDPVLILERTEADWGTVDDDTTEVEMTLYLHNPKSYPITVSKIGYDIYMNNITMGSGEAGRTTAIPPGETVAVEATTEIRTQRLDEWWVSHLQQNQVTDLTMPFYLVIDLSEAGAGEQRIHLDGYQRTVETDLFGTKNATDSGAATDAEDTDESGTDGDDESTATPTDDTNEPSTETATPTGTATPTPTPDGSDDGPLGTPVPTETPTGTTTTSDDGLFAVAATVPR
ncbi:LEA type 2 family protein [Halobaculum marinum]|uniref:LEA type 2 family protein n=1 Tax=Halobaculum marinum TaxID=3031996 RepID=A0ABD5WVM5_9EURY|nr:LEA type 2 family protein [Halobaculum sp. DT55]